MQRIIGLTGGIGSGKSTIAQELTQRGYAVYDCDREAKRIIAENEKVQRAIIDLLGEEAFIKKGTGLTYNTVYVAKRVFEDPNLLKGLDAIVHPAVKEDIYNHLSPITNHLFVESAILYEAGFDQLCDRIIVVDAPEEVRIARVIARDYNGQATACNIQNVRARIHAQKIPTGDLTILNDGQHSIGELADKIVKFIAPCTPF